MDFEGEKAPRGLENEETEEDRERIALSLGLPSSSSWDDIKTQEKVLENLSGGEPKKERSKGAAAA